MVCKLLCLTVCLLLAVPATSAQGIGVANLLSLLKSMSGSAVPGLSPGIKASLGQFTSSQISGTNTGVLARMTQLVVGLKGGKLDDALVHQYLDRINETAMIDRLQKLAKIQKNPIIESSIQKLSTELSRIDSRIQFNPSELASLQDSSPTQLQFMQSAPELTTMVQAFISAGKLSKEQGSQFNSRLEDLFSRAAAAMDPMTRTLECCEESKFNSELSGIAREVANTVEPL